MKVIQPSAPTFIQVVRIQKKADDSNYRLLTYVIVTKVAEGMLLYNTLSCEMVLLEDKESVEMFSIDFLKNHWFIVPYNFDDRKLAKQYRSIQKMLKPTTVGVMNYTILTTTDCNARCFYCYELGRSRIAMTHATASRVVEYIKNNHLKLVEHSAANPNNINPSPVMVHLGWFGGEPLYNKEIISFVCNELAKLGIPFDSKMVSNAYLFDEETVHTAVDLWKLKRVQITLDGTEEVYNRCKAYIYKEGNGYQRVMRNIGLLLDAQVRVIVRMNIDLHNADDLQRLALELKDRFGGRKGFVCYSHPLFEAAAGSRSRKHTDESRKMVYEKQQELKQLLLDLGLTSRGGRLAKELPNNLCMADHGNSVLIAPTGQIGLCEHYTESEFFSDVAHPEQQDTSIIRKFTEHAEDLDICKDCKVYPQCIRLKMCEEGTLCFPEIKKQKEQDIRLAMIRQYERWQKKQEEDPEELTLEIC